MNRKLLGVGSRGDLVGRIQQGLRNAGSPLPTLDEVYGKETQSAIAAYQKQKRLAATGFVDADTWVALTDSSIPSVGERALALTAALEGHGYNLAIGNYDGAWLTWGIVGFTLRSGELQAIIKSVDRKQPRLLDQAFGPQSSELRRVLTWNCQEQKAWALGLTVAGGALTEPWKSSFARFGNIPLVRAEQRSRALADYFEPAGKTARTYQLSSELGVALAFDIHVQNGGICAAAGDEIQRRYRCLTDATELDRREIIVHAVVERSCARFREDVRSRKLAIARGAGLVHGTCYQLENWGLAELEA